MKKTISPRAWLASFFGIFLALVLLTGLLAYGVDPFCQFRYGDKATFNNTAKFSGPGLVKHYPYDTLILGSSMTQNFDMDVFRRELGVEPLHIGIGGIGAEELLSYVYLSEEVGKCETYYIGIEQYMLADTDEYRTPEYLFREDCLAKLRYLFCYESWFRYLPMDLALWILEQLPVSLPRKVQEAMDVDYLGNWEGDFSFGEDVVIRNYLSNVYGVSSVETEGLYARMTERMDMVFESLPGDKSRYQFFFPPYSVLFWFDAQKNGYMETYLTAKLYFVEKAEEYGIAVYDFQAADCVFDLNNYKDMTHYHGAINDWMVSCFATGDYLADRDRVLQNNRILTAGVQTFSDSHGEGLKTSESE